MVERWIRQRRSRRPASKVFEGAGRAKTKGEAGVNVVLLSPHSEAWIETILNADYRPSWLLFQIEEPHHICQLWSNGQ